MSPFSLVLSFISFFFLSADAYRSDIKGANWGWGVGGGVWASKPAPIRSQLDRIRTQSATPSPSTHPPTPFLPTPCATIKQRWIGEPLNLNANFFFFLPPPPTPPHPTLQALFMVDIGQSDFRNTHTHTHTHTWTRKARGIPLSHFYSPPSILFFSISIPLILFHLPFPSPFTPLLADESLLLMLLLLLLLLWKRKP